MFWLICSSAFFRCFMSNSWVHTEYRAESFIWTTGVDCSNSVNHDRVQMLSYSKYFLLVLLGLNMQPLDDFWWYLMLPCLILGIIRYGLKVKWSNSGKGVALYPIPWCSSYPKGSLRVTLDYGRHLYFLLLLQITYTNDGFIVMKNQLPFFVQFGYFVWKDIKLLELYNAKSTHVKNSSSRSSIQLIAGRGNKVFFRRCPRCNVYRRRKWTRNHEVKSWTRLIAFHKALIPLGKVWIQFFSLELRQTRYFSLGEATGLGEEKLWIQTC